MCLTGTICIVPWIEQLEEREAIKSEVLSVTMVKFEVYSVFLLAATVECGV